MAINPLTRSFGTGYGASRTQATGLSAPLVRERRQGQRRREIMPVAEERRLRGRRREDAAAQGDSATGKVLLDLHV